MHTQEKIEFIETYTPHPNHIVMILLIFLGSFVLGSIPLWLTFFETSYSPIPTEITPWTILEKGSSEN